MRNQQNGSQMSDMANKAEQLAGHQQDFEQRMRRNFGQGQENPQVAQQMADEKKQMREQYEQLQKEMQQTSRSLTATQPDTAKKLRDAWARASRKKSRAGWSGLSRRCAKAWVSTR